MGYIQKRRADGLYQAPLIPELFFGANGQPLETWSQYLTTGDHTILRRDSGNPTVPDSDLNWVKVSQADRQALTPTATRVGAQTLELPWYALLVPIGIGALIVAGYLKLKRKKIRKKSRRQW